MEGKSALILGATGGVGGAIAGAMLADGWSVRGLVRDVRTAEHAWPRHRGAMTWVAGDAMRSEDVLKAAMGVSVVVHAVNPPGYRHWDRLVLPMIDNSIAAARATGGARIVLPGTVYNFDPAVTPLVSEQSAQMPRNRNGRVRVEMEARLEAAAKTGVPSLIVRAGDFFGADARSSWFTQVMVPAGKPFHRIVNPVARAGVGHSWAYLPDLAEVIVRLVGMKDDLRPFERLQFEGLWDADGTALPAAIRRVTQRPDLPVTRFSWWAMTLLAPFGGMPREIAEIAPYWRQPMRFDNRRLVELLGEEPRTQIDDALRATLRLGMP